MKTPVKILRRSAELSLAVLQFSCGGGDAAGPTGPAAIAANSATTLSGSPGAPVQERPSVIVRDQNGTPLASISVTFAVTSGGGSLTGASAVTDASGIATVGSWTLGSVVGSNTMTATVGTLPLVVFTANSTDPCIARATHTFGTTTSGELTVEDCRLANGHYRDVFSTSVPAAGAYVFTQVAGFDAFLVVFGADGFAVGANDDQDLSSQNSRVKIFLPSGSARLGATTYAAGVTGTYTVSSAATSATVVGCEEVFVTRGLTTTQNLESTDCAFQGFFSDDMVMYFRAGQAVTVTMTSGAFDTSLEIWDQATFLRVAHNDDMDSTTDNSQLVFTASADGFFWIVPTTTVAGATGAYTLTIQ
jgi:hypothetical protein